MGNTFSARLKRARRNARDPEQGGTLTQERFAELLSMSMERPEAITAGTVSNWERGRAQPARRDRARIWATVAVLLQCGGLLDLCDANAFLICGNYAPLSEEEVQRLEQLLPGLVGDAALQFRTATLLAARDQAIERQKRSRTSDGGSMAMSDTESPGSQARLIAVRHQSMEGIPAQAIRASLPVELRDIPVIELTVGQTDLFRAGRLTDPLAAAQRQQDLAARLAELLADHPNARVAYYGIAHIPLLFLAGYQLSNRRQITLFDFNRRNRLWDQLQLGEEAPPLTLFGLPEGVVRARGAVVVRMSISYLVTSEVVAEVIPEPIGSLHLALEQPRIDVITSEQQVWAYGDQFRQMMDAIHEQFPAATGIHLFYSGPPPLAFYCGQQLSKTIHPQVVVYNYVARDTPNYSWGIDLMRDLDEAGFLITPGQNPGVTPRQ